MESATDVIAKVSSTEEEKGAFRQGANEQFLATHHEVGNLLTWFERNIGIVESDDLNEHVERLRWLGNEAARLRRIVVGLN